MLSSGRKISPPGGMGASALTGTLPRGRRCAVVAPTRTDAAGEHVVVPCDWRATPEGFGEPSGEGPTQMPRRRAGVVAFPSVESVSGGRTSGLVTGDQQSATRSHSAGGWATSVWKPSGEPSGYQTGAGADSSAARQSQGRPSGLTRSPGGFVSCCAPPLPCCCVRGRTIGQRSTVSTDTRTCRAVSVRPVARLLAVTAKARRPQPAPSANRPCRAQHLRPSPMVRLAAAGSGPVSRCGARNRREKMSRRHVVGARP